MRYTIPTCARNACSYCTTTFSKPSSLLVHRCGHRPEGLSVEEFDIRSSRNGSLNDESEVDSTMDSEEDNEEDSDDESEEGSAEGSEEENAQESVEETEEYMGGQI
ncbi:hypothetical protein F443_07854 [Phytophthora nicotianae P1569]|uniref:C2H2-type domain-containing protein n=1 Tax=Phytophthora nicotianae P1569 TaxID=1317065 RepID=V9F989_PHYNI|nr:hypothetical protein F443_07854 [Phytophthora nicotianae P1569]